MQSLLTRTKALLTPSQSNTSLSSSGFRTEKDASLLFQETNPAVDGEDCLHDCANCTEALPRKWSIDESDKLYGHVKGWETHLVVATGKTDWVRDVTDEKGSLMEEVGRVGLEQGNGKVMLSASDWPTGQHDGHGEGYGVEGRTRCLLLPRWEVVEGVGRGEAKWLVEEVLGKGVSNSTPVTKEVPLSRGRTSISEPATSAPVTGEPVVEKEAECNGDAKDDEEGEGEELGLTMSQRERKSNGHEINGIIQPSEAPVADPKPPGVTIKPCAHRAVILMCSHGTRDWRCGKSAPILRREFERHLRPLGLYRDFSDERPGGVGIYFINHVGGHKYSANVMIYRREGRASDGEQNGVNGKDGNLHSEAVQGIWLARVRPEDCENIVKYTVLQGKLVKPQRQLRGGFDRERGVLSW